MLATNSIGYLVTDDNAMVWRGPMASKALMQMLQETLLAIGPRQTMALSSVTR
jgi:Mrp family chromosome partitioning ATPase